MTGRGKGPRLGTALLLHRFPASSYMWRDTLAAIAGAGWRGSAPDLAGFGDSEPDPPGTWTDLLRTEGQGEEFVDTITRESFGDLLRAVCKADESAVEEYWKCCSDPVRRNAVLELYRSGNFEELGRHDGALGRLGVPALVLWGAEDPFAPVESAHRLNREIPGSKLVLFEDTGHFVFDDLPERAAGEVAEFLRHVR